MNSAFETTRQARAFINKCMGGPAIAELEQASFHMAQAKESLSDMNELEVREAIDAAIEDARRALAQAQTLLAKHELSRQE